MSFKFYGFQKRVSFISIRTNIDKEPLIMYYLRLFRNSHLHMDHCLMNDSSKSNNRGSTVLSRARNS